jgi:hypothetical protein
MLKTKVFCAGVGFALIVSGCSTPPTKQMEEAEAAISAAENEGALAYSTEQMMEAQIAFSEAQDAAEKGKNSVARKAAILAKTKATAAQKSIESGKAAMKTEVETRLSVITQDIANLKKTPPSKNALRAKEINAKIAETEKTLADIRTSLDVGNIADANDLMTQAEGSLVEATVSEEGDSTLAPMEKIEDPTEQ